MIKERTAVGLPLVKVFAKEVLDAYKVLQMKESEPVVSAIRRARREQSQTPLGKLGELWRQESKWRRRKTIASNKLLEIQAKIYALAEDHAGLLAKAPELWGSTKPKD